MWNLHNVLIKTKEVIQNTAQQNSLMIMNHNFVGIKTLGMQQLLLIKSVNIKHIQLTKNKIALQYAKKKS